MLNLNELILSMENFDAKPHLSTVGNGQRNHLHNFIVAILVFNGKKHLF